MLLIVDELPYPGQHRAPKTFTYNGLDDERLTDYDLGVFEVMVAQRLTEYSDDYTIFKVVG